MHHEYYYYNKEQLLENPKIPMVVMEDKPTVFKAIAREMADFIKAQNEAGRPPSLSAPLAPSASIPTSWTSSTASGSA